MWEGRCPLPQFLPNDATSLLRGGEEDDLGGDREMVGRREAVAEVVDRAVGEHAHAVVHEDEVDRLPVGALLAVLVEIVERLVARAVMVGLGHVARIFQHAEHAPHGHVVGGGVEVAGQDERVSFDHGREAREDHVHALDTRHRALVVQVRIRDDEAFVGPAVPQKPPRADARQRGIPGGGARRRGFVGPFCIPDAYPLSSSTHSEIGFKLAS